MNGERVGFAVLETVDGNTYDFRVSPPPHDVGKLTFRVIGSWSGEGDYRVKAVVFEGDGLGVAEFEWAQVKSLRWGKRAEYADFDPWAKWGVHTKRNLHTDTVAGEEQPDVTDRATAHVDAAYRLVKATPS